MWWHSGSWGRRITWIFETNLGCILRLYFKNRVLWAMLNSLSNWIKYSRTFQILLSPSLRETIQRWNIITWKNFYDIIGSIDNSCYCQDRVTWYWLYQPSVTSCEIVRYWRLALWCAGMLIFWFRVIPYLKQQQNTSLNIDIITSYHRGGSLETHGTSLMCISDHSMRFLIICFAYSQWSLFELSIRWSHTSF